jgi:Ca2+/Na+ antiporter
MLLTVPWFLAIVGGRVNIVNNKPKYNQQPKLSPPDFFSLDETGVKVGKSISDTTTFMLVSSLPYLLIQIPGIIYASPDAAKIAIAEKGWAMLGFLICVIALGYYLYLQYLVSISPDKSTVQSLAREEYLRSAIAAGDISLVGLMGEELRNSVQTSKDSKYNTEVSPLYSFSDDSMARLERLLKPFFHKYDRDSSGFLDIQELALLFRDLGEHVTPKDLAGYFAMMDKDNSGLIDYREFVEGTAEFVASRASKLDLALLNPSSNEESSATRRASFKGSSKYGASASDPEGGNVNDDDDDDDESGGEDETEEIPADLEGLSAEEQQYRIKWRAAIMLGIGTLVTIIMSDPMVDVLSEIGNRTGISSFYIAFVFAPLASNASEVIAAYNYAQKKTASSMTISLSALQGACIMNNTFVLGIFLLLIFLNGLYWEYFAETLSILLVQIAMALMARKKVHTVRDGFIILALYPLSLLVVATLEACGWD